jgi:hypothetical protein
MEMSSLFCLSLGQSTKTDVSIQERATWRIVTYSSHPHRSVSKCRDHKLIVMILQPTKRCSQQNCKFLALWGYFNVEHCDSHKIEFGHFNPRENAQLEYNIALRDRYKHLPRFARWINLVAFLFQSRKKRIIMDSRKRKEENVRTDNKGSGPPRVPLRKKMFLAEEE